MYRTPHPVNLQVQIVQTHFDDSEWGRVCEHIQKLQLSSPALHQTARLSPR